jgi:uncharacterized protein HemX
MNKPKQFLSKQVLSKVAFAMLLASTLLSSASVYAMDPEQKIAELAQEVARLKKNCEEKDQEIQLLQSQVQKSKFSPKRKSSPAEDGLFVVAIMGMAAGGTLLLALLEASTRGMRAG